MLYAIIIFKFPVWRTDKNRKDTHPPPPGPIRPTHKILRLTALNKMRTYVEFIQSNRMNSAVENKATCDICRQLIIVPHSKQ